VPINPDLIKLYEWRQTQATSLATGCFTLSGLILSPLLAATFDSKAVVEVWQLILYVLGALLAAVSGGWWHLEARRQQQSYEDAVRAAPPPQKRKGIASW
jgi:high-affinity Fe2+/Pb2+ permease